MFISSKLFVWHLSRRIIRMESAEKWAAIYRKKPSRDWLEKDQWESIIPKGCRIESNNTSPNLSVLALLPKNAYFLLVDANLPPRLIPSLLFLIQPLDFLFYKILPALNIMMTADFLFILAQGRSPFHLSALEATFIKTSSPAFWGQKEFVYSLKIVH